MTQYKQSEFRPMSSAERYEPWTPSDSTDLPYESRAIVLQTGGNLKVTRPDGTAVTLALPAGRIEIAATRIWANGTSATGISVLY